MVRTQPEGYQHRRRRRAESESARRSEREEKGGERDGSRADGGRGLRSDNDGIAGPPTNPRQPNFNFGARTVFIRCLHRRHLFITARPI